MKLPISLLITILCYLPIHASAGGPPPLYDWPSPDRSCYTNSSGCVVYHAEHIGEPVSASSSSGQSSNTTTALSMLQQRMLDKSEEIHDISTDTMQNFLTSLHIVAHTTEERLMIDGILYGKSDIAATFYHRLMERLSGYVHCYRTEEFDIQDNTRRQHLFAAYLGIPIALENLKPLTPTCSSSLLSYIFDAEKVTAYRKKQKRVLDYEAPPSAPLRYIWIDTKELEPIFTDEPLKQTVLKFPETTQHFLKGYFKALQ